VKELTQKFIKMQQHDWELICRSVDRDKRTFLHYVRTTGAFTLGRGNLKVLAVHPGSCSSGLYSI